MTDKNPSPLRQGAEDIKAQIAAFNKEDASATPPPESSTPSTGEKLYRWVKASERLPDEHKNIFCRFGEGKMLCCLIDGYFNSEGISYDPRYIEWLEELPSPTESRGDSKDKGVDMSATETALRKALIGLLDENNYDCPMCDHGRLRKNSKEHWDDCPYKIAREVLASTTTQAAAVDVEIHKCANCGATIAKGNDYCKECLPFHISYVAPEPAVDVKEAAEVEKVLIKAQEEYILFLVNESNKYVHFAGIHGMKVSDEVFKQGQDHRDKIENLKLALAGAAYSKSDAAK